MGFLKRHGLGGSPGGLSARQQGMVQALAQAARAGWRGGMSTEALALRFGLSKPTDADKILGRLARMGIPLERSEKAVKTRSHSALRREGIVTWRIAPADGKTMEKKNAA